MDFCPQAHRFSGRVLYLLTDRLGLRVPVGFLGTVAEW